MGRIHNRIIAGVFSVVMLFFSCVPPTSAIADIGIQFTLTDLWSFIAGNYYHDVNMFNSLFDEDVCDGSFNAGGRHNFKEQRTTVDGKTALYYICEYCGKSAGEVGTEGYDAQVSELPASSIGSDGALYYSPAHKYFVLWSTVFDVCNLYCPHHVPSNPSTGRPFSSKDGTLTCTPTYVAFSSATSRGLSAISRYYHYFDLACPVTGTYSLYKDVQGVFRVRYTDGSVSDLEVSSKVGIDFSGYKMVGDSDNCYFYINCDRTGVVRYEASFSGPVYRIIPETGLIDTANDTIYNINSRPTSITGNYGIIGDNGEITKVENNTIVNETNNTVYNPVTGTTTPITDWQYDYSTRTYTVTLDNGTKQIITYGDENITIKEGDTVYNVYYVIDGSSSVDPSPSPSACSHTWTETSSTNPTCIAPGSVSYTCSQCSATKTEVLKALGHTWKVDRTVQTTYDEQGDLIQQGYTIYKCSVCGEQYKDEDTTGPPGGSSDDVGESFWDFLNRLAEMLGEKLAAVANLVLRLLDEIPRLFNGFLDFLSLVFPYLPPEITMLLTFGVVAVVFIGIIKVFRW